MKEILFRGKRVDNGEWVIGQYYKRTHYYGDLSVKHYIIVSTEDLDYDQALEYYEIVPETLGRLVNDPCYTDYTDQRYFQGDIIELYSQKWKNVDERLGIVVDEHCYTANGLGRCFPQDTLQARVIGNVWDTPELVGKKYAELYRYYHSPDTSITKEDLKRNMEVK